MCHDGHIIISGVFCAYQWKQQSSQASVDDVEDVWIVEGAVEEKHEQVEHQDEQQRVTDIELKASLQETTEKASVSHLIDAFTVHSVFYL